ALNGVSKSPLPRSLSPVHASISHPVTPVKIGRASCRARFYSIDMNVRFQKKVSLTAHALRAREMALANAHYLALLHRSISSVSHPVHPVNPVPTSGRPGFYQD